ncbi:SigE family RNA polymerase sigma factor [uncultured Jatrophihabitans sp.]|uniref:SigE family RNA polymerase sigma factor n=1 Tax=uncultured Jatrophihabitans sp. TaxID=1610747 RepID=UPI0035C9F7B0
MADEASGTGLDEFAAQHGVALTRFAYLLCGNRATADDLVQETYLKLHQRFGDRLDVAAPLAYARRTLVNLHISQRRRRAAGEVTLADLPDAPATDAVDHGAQDEMWRMLAGLNERQRAVLVLRHYLDLSDREIASVLGCREGTVRSLASRAVAELRRHPDLAQARGLRS